MRSVGAVSLTLTHGNSCSLDTRGFHSFSTPDPTRGTRARTRTCVSGAARSRRRRATVVACPLTPIRSAVGVGAVSLTLTHGNSDTGSTRSLLLTLTRGTRARTRTCVSGAARSHRRRATVVSCPLTLRVVGGLAVGAVSLTLTHGNSDTGSTRSFSTPDSDARDARADAHVCKRCGAAPQATRHRRSVSPNPSGRRSGGLRCISNS